MTQLCPRMIHSWFILYLLPVSSIIGRNGTAEISAPPPNLRVRRLAKLGALKGIRRRYNMISDEKQTRVTAIKTVHKWPIAQSTHAFGQSQKSLSALPFRSLPPSLHLSLPQYVTKGTSSLPLQWYRLQFSRFVVAHCSDPAALSERSMLVL